MKLKGELFEFWKKKRTEVYIWVLQIKKFVLETPDQKLTIPFNYTQAFYTAPLGYRPRHAQQP